MSSLASIAEVEAIVGADTLRDIADHDGDHVRDDAVIQAALDSASDLALSYCSGQLPIPVPTPLALKRAVVIIAINDMREPRDMGTEGSRIAYQSVISWLKLVAESKAKLSAPEPEEQAGAEVGYDASDPEVDGLERIWSRKSARGVF